MKHMLSLIALVAVGLLMPFCSYTQSPSDRQFQAIQKLMAPNSKKVTDILAADKTGQYKTYQADLAAMIQEKDPGRQQDLAAKLDRDHLAFIRKAYAAANINNEALKQEVAKILGPIKFSFGEFADILIEVVPPGLALPERFDVTLNCPFEAIDESDNNTIVAECDAEAGNCVIRVESLAEIAGGCRSKGDVGGTFELPEGTFTSITAVVQSDISYHGFAVAVAGYGQINAKFGVRLRAPGIDKLVITREEHAVAPLVWYRSLHGDVDNFTAQAGISGSFPTGTVVKAQAHTEVFALSLPIFSLTEMDANTDHIDSIRISGSN